MDKIVRFENNQYCSEKVDEEKNEANAFQLTWVMVVVSIAPDSGSMLDTR
jgi:hypothetical protein